MLGAGAAVASACHAVVSRVSGRRASATLPRACGSMGHDAELPIEPCAHLAARQRHANRGLGNDRDLDSARVRHVRRGGLLPHTPGLPLTLRSAKLRTASRA